MTAKEKAIQLVEKFSLVGLQQRKEGIACAIIGSFLFDKELLEKATIKQPEYVMGVDTYDKDTLVYCFGRKVDGVFEVMLSKTMRDENEFKQEVENLAKYFNADVFWNGD
jgi:hypothetical protein